MSEELDPQVLQRLSEQFDDECQRRHIMGERKYGAVKFLEVNALAMAMEELVDLGNYARYAWIKCALLMHMDPSTQGPVGSDIDAIDLSNEESVQPQAPQGLFSTVHPNGFFNPYRKDAQ